MSAANYKSRASRIKPGRDRVRTRPSDAVEEGVLLFSDDRSAQMNKLNVTLEELETFLMIVRLGSFNQTAEALGVSQPTVTARIKKIESALGSRLFLRTTRKVLTTPAGAKLQAASEPLITRLRLLKVELQQDAKLTRGAVTLAASPTIAAVTLPPIIAKFNKIYPDVVVKLRDEQLGQALSDLNGGLVDFAICGQEPNIRGLAFEPLFMIEYYVIAPRDHPVAKMSFVTYEDLAKFPLITMPSHVSIWSMIAAEIAEKGLTFQPSFEAFSAYTILGMVEAKLGITLLPSISLSFIDLNRFVAVKLAGAERFLRTIGITRVRDRALSQAAEVFCTFARNWIREQIRLHGKTYLPPN